VFLALPPNSAKILDFFSVVIVDISFGLHPDYISCFSPQR